jgi:hypothetical protein
MSGNQDAAHNATIQNESRPTANAPWHQGNNQSQPRNGKTHRAPETQHRKQKGKFHREFRKALKARRMIEILA